MTRIGRLHVITDTQLQARFSHAELAALAIAGGADTIQFRHKSGSTRQLVEEGDQVQTLCAAQKVSLIVNDRVDVALALGAAGVHLGQEDMPVEIGRRLMPPQALIGASARTEERILAAIRAGADYIGYGPIFATPSKPDAESPKGLAGLERICAAATCPVIAIGGITCQTVASVMRAGAYGIAVIAAVCCQPDPQAATQRLVEQIDRARR